LCSGGQSAKRASVLRSRILVGMFDERLTLTINISSANDGSLQLVALLAHPRQAIHVDPANLTATLWAESDDVLRISLQHRASRTLAYIQGNRALRTLCAHLHLRLVPQIVAEQS
jgi:hypothetical protein